MIADLGQVQLGSPVQSSLPLSVHHGWWTKGEGRRRERKRCEGHFSSQLAGASWNSKLQDTDKYWLHMIVYMHMYNTYMYNAHDVLF